MKAKKRLGQNFLHDKAVLQKIIEAGEVTKSDLIIEVGTGRGALTEELVKHAGHVKALEIDDDLIPGLKIQFAGTKNLEIIHEDVLNFQVFPPDAGGTKGGGTFKVIANIPYYITSPIIRHFLYQHHSKSPSQASQASHKSHLSHQKPSLMVLLIQKEVAQKICSSEGSVLSLMIKVFSDPEIICTVPKTAFKPQPKVESAVLKLTVLDQPRINCDFEKFLKFIKIAFAQPRKTLANNLTNGLHREKLEIEQLLTSLNLDPRIRPQKLTFEQWEKLLEELS